MSNETSGMAPAVPLTANSIGSVSHHHAGEERFLTLRSIRRNNRACLTLHDRRVPLRAFQSRPHRLHPLPNTLHATRSNKATKGQKRNELHDWYSAMASVEERKRRAMKCQIPSHRGLPAPSSTWPKIRTGRRHVVQERLVAPCRCRDSDS